MDGSVPIPFQGDWVLITGAFGLEPSDQFASRLRFTERGRATLDE
jgi:hypothetical protein